MMMIGTAKNSSGKPNTHKQELRQRAFVAKQVGKRTRNREGRREIDDVEQRTSRHVAEQS